MPRLCSGKLSFWLLPEPNKCQCLSGKRLLIALSYFIRQTEPKIPRLVELYFQYNDNIFQVFETHYKLYNHRYANHNLEEVQCEFCGGNYKSKKLLHAHKKVSHPDLYEAAKNAKHLQEIQEYAASMHNNAKQEPAPPPLPPPAEMKRPSHDPESVQPPSHKKVSHPDLYEAARNAKHLQEYAAAMHNNAKPPADMKRPSHDHESVQPPSHNPINPVPMFPPYH